MFKQTNNAAMDYLSLKKVDRLGNRAHLLPQMSNSSWIRAWDRFGIAPSASPQR